VKQISGISDGAIVTPVLTDFVHEMNFESNSISMSAVTLLDCSERLDRPGLQRQVSNLNNWLNQK
jgi:hypothetical protein